MNATTFVEQDCTFRHEGQSFSANGAWIGRHKVTGKLGGILYAFPKESKVGTWNGSKKVSATFAREWRSCFGDTRQAVYFTWDDVPFSGVYFKSGSDIVRAREVKR